MLLSENVPDVKEKRKNWVKNLLNYDAEKMVFVDESGVNINMTRIYGRSIGGDTDTIAAIGGGIAGILYGFDSIPKEWISSLIKQKDIDSMCLAAEQSWCN